MDDKLIGKIIQHEGLRLFPYKCTAGKLTIGIGRNIQDRGISRDEAMYLLKNDVELSTRELSHYEWFTKLDEVRKGVLIELHFNIGLGKLLKFKNMLSFIDSGYFSNASTQLLKSLWASQVGENRSKDMAYRLKNGEYQ